MGLSLHATLQKLARASAAASLVAVLGACAHLTPGGSSAPSIGGDGKPQPSVPAGSAAEPTDTQNQSQNQPSNQAPSVDLSDSGADLRAIPLAVNRQVLKWIDYFQGQGRPHMERYLSRSTRYMPLMKAILKKEGLPEDLIYIALIESGFSSTAKSSAQAVGFWQFIKGTGRRYGLKIDSYVDERRDFVRSTQASAQYFKELYEIFHGWYLAVASYNVGENRVKNVIVKYRTRDFWQLARENKLPLETSDYVPKFIAARLIAKEPEKYGFGDIDYQAPIEFSEVEFTTSIDIRKLAKEMNLEYDDLRDLNPSYKRGVAFEKNGKLVLRVPKGQEAQALAAGGAAVAGSRKAYVADEDYSYYKVRRGDTIAMIAKKFGTSQRNIRTMNKLSVGARLAAGHRLRVPAENVAGLSRQDEKSKSSQQPAAESAEPAASQPVKKEMAAGSPRRVPQGRHINAIERRIHIVRKGDTLIEIARKYKISVRKLAKYNHINRRGKVSVGMRLEIPTP